MQKKTIYSFCNKPIQVRDEKIRTLTKSSKLFPITTLHLKQRRNGFTQERNTKKNNTDVRAMKIRKNKKIQDTVHSAWCM